MCKLGAGVILTESGRISQIHMRLVLKWDPLDWIYMFGLEMKTFKNSAT